MFSLYLPIAGHSINMFLLFGVGGGVGFLSGLFGVGGGFLMTPLLIMFGIPSVVAAASDSNQIVAAATSGSIAHYRMGNVDLKMGIFLLIGGFLGGTIGVELIKILRTMGDAGFVIKLTYIVMLGLVGSVMMLESLRSLRRRGREAEAGAARPSLYLRMIQRLPWQMRFPKSQVTLSPILPLLVGTFVGALSAVMGLGGGFIMIPVMYYGLRMPMNVAVGTNLFQEVWVCAYVTFMQATTNRTVDLVLAMILLAGSVLGAQVGARLSNRLHADHLKILLAALVLLVMIKILLGVTIAPDLLMHPKAIH
jgi:uncharacterized membrane protein YfcA